MMPESQRCLRRWQELEEFCLLSAMKAAVSLFPKSDFSLKCLTSHGCPQPYRCIVNSIFVSTYYFVSTIMMGPYLIVDTLFVKPKMYRLYQRYLMEGEELEGRICFRTPTTEKNCIEITLVEYEFEDATYAKYLAHGYDEENLRDNKISLMILPRFPKSACSKWTANMYVQKHSTCHYLTMILWALWLTSSAAVVIALSLKWEMHEDCTTTLLVWVPTALLLVCVYLYLRNDPVQKFLLESGKEIRKQVELGDVATRNHVEEDWAEKTVISPTPTFCSCTEGYFCGVSSQTMEDRWDEESECSM